MTGAPSITDTVLQGRNGRLFLASQDSFDLRRFLGPRSLSLEQHARWRLTLQRRAAELAELGIPYVFNIVPDAPTVYPEDLPDDLAPGVAPVGARLAAELQDIPNLTVVYPLPDMLQAKGGLPLYRKTDTHWSSYGAYVGYRAVCKALAGLLPIRPVSASDIRFAMQREFGDLGALVQPEQVGSNLSMRIGEQQFERGPLAAGPDRTNSQIFRCAGAPPTRVLILRDSFMTEQAPLMALSFGETEMVGTTSRLFLDHVVATRPNLVMTEICERRLTEWESDHQLAGFAELFGTDWVSDTGRIALGVELLLRQNRPVSALAAASPLLNQAELSPGHAFTIARAGLAARDFPTADRLIRRAIDQAPERAALLCLGAQVRFSMADGTHALQLATAARQQAPWNGFTHELLAYMLLAFDRPREALAVVHAAQARIIDHPNLFLLGSQAAERCDDLPGALAYMRQAASLWPDNAEFQSRLADLAATAPSPADAVHSPAAHEAVA